MFLAHYWLKEVITRRDLVGTVLIILGAIFVAAFGAREETEYTLDELIELYNRWSILIYGLFIIGLLIFL